MKIKTNEAIIDLGAVDEVILDENIIFIRKDTKVDTININEAPSIVVFRERHNDWECEIVDPIIEMIADDFFYILESEHQEEKVIDYEATIAQILSFYLPEEAKDHD